MNPDGVSTGILGLVKGLVGELEESRGATLSHVAGARDADAGCDGEHTVIDGDAESVQSGPEAFGDVDGGGELAVGSDDHELLTAIAGDEVGSARGVGQYAGGLAEDFVTGRVTIVVVDAFEAVEVGDDHGERSASAAAHIPFANELFFEEGSVSETGEAVEVGAAFEHDEGVGGFEGGADASEKFGGDEWSRDEVRRTELKGADTFLGACEIGVEDDGNRTGGWVFLEALYEFEAVVGGQAKLREDEVGLGDRD